MRFLLSICCLLFCCSTAYAQEVVEQGIGVELGAHHGSRRISAGTGRNFLQLEEQDSLESGIGGLGVGFLYTSRVNKVGFTTGLRYLQTGYDVARRPDATQGEEFSFSQEVRAKYLSLPFELNFYQDIKPKDRVFFTLGVAAHFHLGTDVTEFTFTGDEQTGERVVPRDPEEEFRSPIVSLNTSLGYDRKFNERWSLRVEPNFQFFLQGNLKSNFERFNRNYYQLGVRVLVRRFI